MDQTLGPVKTAADQHVAFAAAGAVSNLPQRPNGPRRRGRMGRLLRIGLAIVLAICGLVGIGAFRLSRGPISLGFLVPTIEQATRAELGGHALHIKDIQLHWRDAGPELEIVEARITQADGRQLLQAPRAVAVLSPDAAWRGRIAFKRISLINPRLQAFYSEDGTLSVKFSASSDSRQAQSGDTAPAPTPTDDAGDSGPVEFVKAITEISAQARRREHATAYLHEIGLQQATLIIDNGRRKTVWRVPELRVDLSHKAKRSLISGFAQVDSLSGPWSLTFQTAELDATQDLAVDAKVNGLNLRGLARQLPILSALETVDAPLDGHARLSLTAKGRLMQATFALTARPGRLLGGSGVALADMPIEGGAIRGVFDPQAGRITIDEASLAVGSARLDLAGELLRDTKTNRDDAAAWSFKFASKSGILPPVLDGAPPHPIDEFRIQGTAFPEVSRLKIEDFVLRAGGAAIAGQGQVTDIATDASRASGFEARIQPMPLAQLLAMWPSTYAPAARTWISQHVTRGQISGGTVKFSSTGDDRIAVSLDLGGVLIVPAPGAAALDIPRAHARIDATGIEMTAADVNVGQEGKRLLLKGMRLTAARAEGGGRPQAELSFRLLGPLAAAIDIADREPFKLLKTRGISLQAPEGRLDGQFKISVALSETAHPQGARVEGRLRLADGRLRQIFGQHDLTGAKVDIEIGDTAVDVRGDMLLKGIPIKLQGQHLLGVAQDRQAPFRLTTKLDDSDRSQLGLDINDIVSGEVPLEILISSDGKGGFQPNLSGDLTRAELTLDAVNYKKTSGVPARVQFSAAKTAQGRTELRNFKLTGDTIAADGTITLGVDGKAKELSFPDFSLNVVTRLDVQGKLRPDNIWEVKARGLTFDGRDLFRDLFSVQAQTKPVAKDKAGLDLAVDIDTVLGFSDTSLKGVRLTLQRRNENGHEKTVALKVNATHENGRPFEATIRSAGERKLIASSQDAGQIFKLVGFYPNAIGGRMALEVSLDGQGVAERTGVLKAEQFAVLGDAIVSDTSASDQRSQGSAKRKVIREKIDFDWMVLPFSVGCSQFVMNDMEIRGPLLGASMRGKADFKSQKLQMGGTYVPLSGLNSAIGVIPGIGQLLTGPKGEGIFGVTFAVLGPMANPEVLINPLSGLLPGILRETQQLAPQSYRITPCATATATPTAKSDAARASSSGPTTAGRDGAASTPRAQPPSVITDWSSDTRKTPKPPPQQ